MTRYKDLFEVASSLGLEGPWFDYRELVEEIGWSQTPHDKVVLRRVPQGNWNRVWYEIVGARFDRNQIVVESERLVFDNYGRLPENHPQCDYVFAIHADGDQLNDFERRLNSDIRALLVLNDVPYQINSAGVISKVWGILVRIWVDPNRNGLLTEYPQQVTIDFGSDSQPYSVKIGPKGIDIEKVFRALERGVKNAIKEIKWSKRFHSKLPDAR